MYKYARPSKPQTPNSMHEETSTDISVSSLESTHDASLQRNLLSFNHRGLAFEDWLRTCREVTKFLTGKEPDFGRWNLSKKLMRRGSEMPVYIPNAVDLSTAIKHMEKMGFDVSGIKPTKIIGFCTGFHDETLLRIRRSGTPDPKPTLLPTQGMRVIRHYADDNYLCLLGWIYATILFRTVTGSALDSDGTFTVTPSNRLWDRCLYVGVKDGVVTTDIMRFDTKNGLLGKRLVRKVRFK